MNETVFSREELKKILLTFYVLESILRVIISMNFKNYSKNKTWKLATVQVYLDRWNEFFLILLILTPVYIVGSEW